MLRRKPDPTARLKSVLALPDTAESLPELVRVALDPSPDVARAALRLLASRGGPAEASALRGHMLRVDLAVVPACATTLRLLGDRSAVEVACEGLRNESPTVRTAAALALRELRDDRAAPALRDALEDDQAGVRRPALAALAALRPSAENEAACARLLDDRDEGVRIASVKAVSVIGSDAEGRLRSILADESARVRRELARGCATFDPEFIGRLLTDRDADVRAEAAWALVANPRRALVSLLISTLDDPSWHVRRAACRALGAAGDVRARAGLVSRLLDPRDIVHDTAVWALSDIFGDRLWRVLVDDLDSADAALRRALVYVLADKGDERAAGAVAELERDPSPDVRIAVAHTLPILLPQAYAPVLERLARDPDPDVRHAASTVVVERKAVNA